MKITATNRQTNHGRQGSTGGNTGFAPCGVECLNSSSVFQINFSAGLTVLCLEIPHERHAANRYLQANLNSHHQPKLNKDKEQKHLNLEYESHTIYKNVRFCFGITIFLQKDDDTNPNPDNPNKIMLLNNNQWTVVANHIQKKQQGVLGGGFGTAAFSLQKQGSISHTV